MAARSRGGRQRARVVRQRVVREPPRESLIDWRLRVARGEAVDDPITYVSDDDSEPHATQSYYYTEVAPNRSCLAQLVWFLLLIVVLFIGVTVVTGYFGIDLKTIGTRAAAEAVTNLGPTPQIVVRDQQGNIINVGPQPEDGSKAGPGPSQQVTAAPSPLTSEQMHAKIIEADITYKQLVNVQGHQMPNGIFVVMADVDSANIPPSDKIIGTIVEDSFVNPNKPDYPCSLLGEVTYPKYVTENNIPDGRIPRHPAEGAKKGQSFFCSAQSGASNVMGRVVFLFPADQ